MYFELPKLKRCCCCVPLRYGLIAWGYVKLIIVIALLLLISTNLYVRINRPDHKDIATIYILSVIVSYFAVEGAFLTIMLVGAHRKNHKLLKIYFVYSLIDLFLCLILYTTNLVVEIYHFRQAIADVWFYIIENASVGFFYILLNFYLITLLRSEILKLRANAKFQFVNNAADAVCTMNLDYEQTTKETGPSREEIKT